MDQYNTPLRPNHIITEAAPSIEAPQKREKSFRSFAQYCGILLTMKKTVLYFSRKADTTFNAAALQSQADRYDWILQIVPPDCTVHQVRTLIKFWRPSGCIINNDALSPALFRGISSVFICRDPKDIPAKALTVTLDEQIIGEIAAREFLSLGCASFAFVPAPYRPYWCSARESAYAAALEINGRKLLSFDWHRNKKPNLRTREQLGKWLLTLPRPAGVFAANDEIAAEVISVCNVKGIPVPGDVMVLGADDNPDICESSRPTISSIIVDGGERRYSEIIDWLESRSSARTHKPLTLTPSGITRRASTNRPKRYDRQVAEALDFIRRNAASPDIDVGVVVRRAFTCSRRMAEMRFRNSTGKSILETIRALRLNKARHLLADGHRSVESIAGECGYASANSLRNLLREMS